ncbi:unnamed protein product [Phytophthora fragariaefolia]|uniref:Unnamed protein product n=1 Tax=Phytophthora fragariaefolia TaxID=1490495 RepID=A0A9W7D0A6_9STRA|nr:unnamed protein product [Phytophthora fragariaefolia]
MADQAEDQDMANDSPDRQPSTSHPVRRFPHLAAQQLSEDHDMAYNSPGRPSTTSTTERPVRRSPRLAGRVSYSPLVQAECNYCGVLIRSAQPGKNMQRHVKSCSDVPAAVKQRIREAFPDAQHHPSVPTLRGSALATDGITTGDGNIPESAFTTLQQQQFNVALATMFYLCALPFAVVESPAFREPFKLLAPGIRFPSRHSLSGDLLRCVREQIRERAVALIRLQKFVTIVTDS